MPDLTDTERFDRFRLARTENVGPITFQTLLRRFGSARAALDALPALARRGGRGRPLKAADAGPLREELTRLDRRGGRLIVFGEPDYPLPLAMIEDAPPILQVIGHPHLLSRRAVSIVGARNASTNGRSFATRLATELADAGWLVVSGLARGIDTAAHDGALTGGTAAVLAGGVDVVYPPENAALHGRIAAEGLLVSEMPLSTEPQARHFPRRNRIISGLSLGVIVVEAARRSGSLITTTRAADQGRAVFAVPGTPLDPRAQGCNDLIRQGAILVQTAQDILDELAQQAPPIADGDSGPTFLTGNGQGAFAFDDPAAPSTDAETLSQAREAILKALSPAPTAVDELIRDCQVSPAAAWTVLLDLELAGRIERQPGNQVALL